MHASGGRPGTRPWAACSPVQAAASAAGNGQNASAASPSGRYTRAHGAKCWPRGQVRSTGPGAR